MVDTAAPFSSPNLVQRAVKNCALSPKGRKLCELTERAIGFVGDGRDRLYTENCAITAHGELTNL
jgi:hypothetical protein